MTVGKAWRDVNDVGEVWIIRYTACIWVGNDPVDVYPGPRPSDAKLTVPTVDDLTDVAVGVANRFNCCVCWECFQLDNLERGI